MMSYMVMSPSFAIVYLAQFKNEALWNKGS